MSKLILLVLLCYKIAKEWRDRTNFLGTAEEFLAA